MQWRSARLDSSILPSKENSPLQCHGSEADSSEAMRPAYKHLRTQVCRQYVILSRYCINDSLDAQCKRVLPILPHPHIPFCEVSQGSFSLPLRQAPVQGKCTQAFCPEQLSNIITSGLALDKDDGKGHGLAAALRLPGLLQQQSCNII